MIGNETRRGIAEVDFKEVLFVFLFGAIGGFLSWLYAIAVGQQLRLTPLAAIPTSIALGMGAALIGVYVIANTDTRAFMRCLGFALLCGFSWKPIYDAGSALIDQRIQEHQERTAMSLAEKSAKLAQELSSAPPDQLPMKLTQTVNTTVDALDAGQKVESSRVQKEVGEKTDQVVKKISELAAMYPMIVDKEALNTLSREQARLLTYGGRGVLREDAM